MFAFALQSLLPLRFAVAGGDTLNVALSATAASPPIPVDFVGFSLEINNAGLIFGLPPAPMNSVYVQLMQNIAAASGGRGPNVRIGGNSADMSLFWPPGSGPLPPNISYAITAADLEAYARAIPAWCGSLVLDTVLAGVAAEQSARLAAAHYAAARAALPAALLDTMRVEIGNVRLSTCARALFEFCRLIAGLLTSARTRSHPFFPHRSRRRRWRSITTAACGRRAGPMIHTWPSLTRTWRRCALPGCPTAASRGPSTAAIIPVIMRSSQAT